MNREKFIHESQEFFNKTEASVQDSIIKVGKPEQLVVIKLILTAWKEGYKVTQRDIAIHETWIGAHPKWEIKKILAGFTETSTRRVREIVRDLRVIWHVPILSDEDGYFFAFNTEDARRVLMRIESEVYSRNLSSVQTYREMQKMFGSISDFIDQIDRLNKSVESRFSKSQKEAYTQSELFDDR